MRPQGDNSGRGIVVDAATGRYGHGGRRAGFESRGLANGNGARVLMNETIRAVA